VFAVRDAKESEFCRWPDFRDAKRFALPLKTKSCWGMRKQKPRVIKCSASYPMRSAGVLSWLSNRFGLRLTDRAMAGDPWRSVYWDLGKRPKARVVRDVYFWAEYCFEGAAYRAANPNWGGMSAFEPRGVECGRVATPAQHARAALKRLKLLETIEPTLRRRCPDPSDKLLERVPDGTGL
jgi:hypothetical protein